MGLGSFLKEKLRDMASKPSVGVRVNPDPPEYQYGERLTQDKRLVALRRLRNRQLDIVEREQLENSVRRFEREKASKDFLGESMLGKPSRKRVPSVKARGLSFLGRGGL